MFKVHRLRRDHDGVYYRDHSRHPKDESGVELDKTEWYPVVNFNMEKLLSVREALEFNESLCNNPTYGFHHTILYEFNKRED